MSKRVIASPLAPKAVGPYSQAVEANGTLYVSGQLPIDAQTGEFPEGGVKEQLVQIFKNLQYILEEAGYSFDNVVKTTVYLTNMGDFGTLNEVLQRALSCKGSIRSGCSSKRCSRRSRCYSSKINKCTGY